MRWKLQDSVVQEWWVIEVEEEEEGEGRKGWRRDVGVGER